MPAARRGSGSAALPPRDARGDALQLAPAHHDLGADAFAAS